MKNSYRYFENRDCKYYPCHEGTEELNCLFCYCPLYHMDNGPGNPTYKVRNERTVKICSACTFPHRAENYERIIELIRK